MKWIERVEDPFNEGKIAFVTILKAERFDSAFLHYVVDFRVVSGFLEIFGGVYCASKIYQRVTAPQWFGCYRSVCASLVAYDTGDASEITVATCERCRGYCGKSYSRLCDITMKVGGKERVVCCFRDSTTAFGTCSCLSMVTSTPAFSNTISAGVPDWDNLVGDIVLSLLRNPSSTSEYTSNSNPIMVFGQGGTGKSTLCCFLINKLLTLFDRVAFLDTDLGQPILTPSGQVSLHLVCKPLIGVPHSFIGKKEAAHQEPEPHMVNLLSMFGYGVATDAHPTVYLSCVGECHLKYQQLLSGALQELSGSTQSLPTKTQIYGAYAMPSILAQQGYLPSSLCKGPNGTQLKRLIEQFVRDPHTAKVPVPLVINTHGWVTGLGWQLVNAIGSTTWTRWGIELRTPSEMTEMQNLDTNSASGGTLDSIAILSNLVSPFQDIIDAYCGQFPVAWATAPSTILRQLTSVAPLRKPSAISLSSRSKRWLRFMSYFNVCYSDALDVYGTTDEEFFHASVLSPFIKCPELFMKTKCQLIGMKLWGEGDELSRVVFSLPGFLPSDNLCFSDIVSCTTANIVALGRIDRDRDASKIVRIPQCTTSQHVILWEAETLFEVLGYAWMHSFSVETKEVFFYVPHFFLLSTLSCVNALAVGHDVHFFTSPKDTSGALPFPDLQTLDSACGSSKGLPLPITDTIVSKFSQLRAVATSPLSQTTPYQRTLVFRKFTGGKRSSVRNLLPRASHKKVAS